MNKSSNPTHNSSWSRLGLGTGTLASLGRKATVSDVDVLLGTMSEIGVTVIDTADSYGSGDCERLLGRALRGRRERYAVTTKVGYRYSNLPSLLRPLNQFAKKGLHHLGFRQCFTPSYLMRCVDQSLKRLGTTWIDALLLHSPPLETVIDPAVHMLIQHLKASGKTGMVGISSENAEVIRASVASGVFEVIQSPASIKDAVSMRALWKECETAGVRIIGNHVFDPACLSAQGVTHELLMRCASSLLPTRATILCGTRNPAHLRQAHEWATSPLSEDIAEQLLLRFCR